MIVLTNVKLRIAKAPPNRIGPVPIPGQYTDDVLARLLGYDRATLEELREAKVNA